MASPSKPEGEQAGVAVVSDSGCPGGHSQVITCGVASDVNEAETACDP